MALNEQIYLFHQHKSKVSASPLGIENQEIFLFETCLRKIYLGGSDLKASVEEQNLEGELFEDSHALYFILEVMSGLQSRILGETEIFGQFKEFVRKIEESGSSLFRQKEILPFLYCVVKEVRERYIRHWGVQSYGGSIRKLAKPYESVSIIGAGNFVQEILPWLKEKKVQLLVRNAQKVSSENWLSSFPNVSVAELTYPITSSCLVIAAPLAATDVEKLVQSSSDRMFEHPVRIIDGRGLSDEIQSLKSLRGFSDAVEIIELQDIFSEIEREQVAAQEQLTTVKNYLRTRVESFVHKESHRPLGWDDLCA